MTDPTPQAPPATQSPRRSETARRFVAASAILAVAGGALAADFFVFRLDVLFTAVLTIATILAFGEFCDMCEARGFRPFRIWGMAVCVGLVWLHWLALSGLLSAGAGWPLLEAGSVAAVFAIFLRQFLIRDNRDALPAVGMTLLGVVYLWFLPCFLVRIRHLEDPLGNAEWLLSGNALLISTVVVSKASDVGAYFVGRSIGRHKLIPRISPAKSVEGAIAGLAASVGAAYGCAALGLLPGLREAWMIPALGVLAGAAGQCGDLLESLFKRSGGVKDSGGVFPGYGGVLDVIDSLLISAPAIYLFLRFAAGLELAP
ncbi:MAG TPA: phosphatidate cytidylyltransferase [Planctomycetota bacterium]|nr:phosphatidate cytidylyltransferase [Planctomycetota bacterium]